MSGPGDLPALLLGQFSAEQWALMLAIGLISGLVHGFVGIGFPLIATPLFALLFDFQQAVILLVLPTLVMVGCTFVAFGRVLDPRAALRRYWPLLPMLPLGIVAGTRALFVFDPRLLMLMLAAVIVAFLIVDRRRRGAVGVIDRHATGFAFPFGFLAGFCEGTVNVSGPMLLIYFLLLDLEATVIIAAMNYLFLIGKVVQSGTLLAHGAFDAAVWQAALPLSLAGAATFFIGVRLRGRVDPSRYRGWLKATLAVMALLLMVRVAR
ncbi:MAG: sulfite exporter TauE/SafE family protein [Lautropia sp.]